MTRQHRLGQGLAALTAALALTTAPAALPAHAADKTVKPLPHGAAAPTAGAGHHGGDPDGGWEGDGLRLNAEDNRKVDAYIGRARAAEPRISAQVRAAADLSQAELVGFDHRLKSPDSLKRKVATDLKEHPGQKVEEALARLTDAVRYTLQWPDDRYVSGVTTATEVLSAWGNETTKWRNTWGSEKGYRGLNSGWRAPRSRQLFEVQFHTPASKWAQEVTHKLYEEQRLPTTTPERKRELQAQQDAIFASVAVPDGAPALAPPAPLPQRPTLAPAA
ncbi:ATP nucleotide 3'-pyrophosphokinase [Streptomyces sp. G45]|uniref:ATP nucleotide 3'-pyrophosphokinase n=1 Tax=Streptomyces sp. G45 TaxID=3406627 RepID=UPI003C150B1E